MVRIVLLDMLNSHKILISCKSTSGLNFVHLHYPIENVEYIIRFCWTGLTNLEAKRHIWGSSEELEGVIA